MTTHEELEMDPCAPPARTDGVFTEPQVKHTCHEKYTSSGTDPGGNPVNAEGEGYGTGATKEEACAAATQEAMEKAAELLRYKTLVENRIIGIGDDNYDKIAPFGSREQKRPWHGRFQRKTWQFQVTAVIPHLETVEPLWIAVQLLRRQTIRPYIIVVDTGSTRRARELLERMRAEDLEIHYIMSNCYRSSSGPVPVAMDLAHSLCQTDYLFHTHSDVFLRRDNFLADLLALCNASCPAVGYRMSDRGWITDEWSYMVGHTATMLYLPEIEKSGATWSMERIYRQDFVLRDRALDTNGWPDTETGYNRILKSHGIKPLFIGDDLNYQRYVDKNIDHVRSYPGAQLYSKDYFANAQDWMRVAMKEALIRLGIL